MAAILVAVDPEVPRLSYCSKIIFEKDNNGRSSEWNPDSRYYPYQKVLNG